MRKFNYWLEVCFIFMFFVISAVLSFVSKTISILFFMSLMSIQLAKIYGLLCKWDV